MEKEPTWDLEISPRKSLFDINFRELVRYRDLIFLFVKRDFVAQYKQTILGPLWHLIQPILTTIMFMIIFGRIAHISTDGIPPILFYITGITFWTYFSNCITATSNTFVGNASIFGKVYFPRLVMPLSVTISNLIKLGIQFLLVVVVMIYYQFHGFPILFTANWFLLPFIVLLMAGIGLGLGIIISSLTTKYRDLTFLVTFAVQLSMYLTPVAYPFSVVEGQSFGRIVALNPMTAVMESFKYCLYGHGTINASGVLYAVGFMLTVLIIGILMFNKVESTFMDTV